MRAALNTVNPARICRSGITGLFLNAVVMLVFAGKAASAAPGSGEVPPSPAPAAAYAAPAVAPPVPVPDDPLGRGTPRSSVETFFAAAQGGDFAVAAKYLDLSALAADEQAAQGPRLARQLWFVLERQAATDFSKLSTSPLGDLTDGLPPNRERLARIEWPGGFADVNLERVHDPDGLEVWKVSSRSVEGIPKLYKRFRLPLGDLFFSEKTVDWLVKTKILGLSGVTWLAIAVSLCIWAILAFVSLRVARWFIGRMRPGFAQRLLSTIHLPVIVLIVTAFVRAMLPQRLISGEISAFFRAQTGFIAVMIWILFRAADFTAQQARRRLLARDSAGLSLIDLLRRIVKVSLLLIGLLLWLDNMGFNVTTIVASLGVIGLAVGLASKNFIEDLIGAMTLHATGVVKRDESIRFGGQFGVVEDVGLRTTTIRTRERSLVTMPNATFAATQIENLGRRDKFLFMPRLGLRYETTPDQFRYVLIELRKLLYAHPRVQDEDLRVRFTGFGDYSLDLDIYCYVSETTYAGYLAVAEDLNLRIMDIVAQAGTGFAFPSVTEYRAREQANDEALARQAEAEVRRSREQGKLYQHQFTDEVIRELTGTLKYPDSGATDGQAHNHRT